jgi:glyoxylate/hydroxypyruvate reductase A
MKLLIDSTTKDLTPWVQAFQEAIPFVDVVTWQQVDNADEVEVAILWNHRKDLFDHLNNVKLICSLGAGVDHILSDPKIPIEVPITRIVSEELSGPMSVYCIGAITYYERKFDTYRIDQQNKVWNQEFDPERHLHVGIMGLGVLGQDLASKLVMLGYEVSGWSNSRKVISGVKSYVKGELDEFLQSIDLVICMLPATAETKHILNAELFQKMRSGSYLINVARGHHQVNEDIIEALDSGQLAGVFLDVFPVEPIPPNDPIWNHPKVVVTPHIAVVTKLEAAVPQIKENIRRLQAGEKLINRVEKSKGY